MLSCYLLNNKLIYLVGTAHISQESVDLVSEVIDGRNSTWGAGEDDEGRRRLKTDPIM